MAMTKKAEKTKKRLLQSAQRLINERGYDAVSVEDITKASGTAKGTFYHYFQTKDEIVMEIIHQSAHDRFKEVMTESAPIAERLFHFFLYMFSDVDAIGVHLARQWMRKTLSQDQKSVEMSEQFLIHYKRVSAIIESGIQNKELLKDTPVNVVARIIISHVYGALTIWCMMNGKWSLVETGKDLLREDVERLLQPYLIKK